jgi:SsrA-binding protein
MNNKKAYFEYFILEEFTAGLKLIGSEVKSLREKNCNLDGAYCYIEGNKIFIKNMFIKEFGNSCIEVDPYRVRELLLNKHEIRKIEKELQVQGITMIPLKVVLGNSIKLQLGLGKGKKLYDKRETIKARDIEREIKREQA